MEKFIERTFLKDFINVLNAPLGGETKKEKSRSQIYEVKFDSFNALKGFSFGK